MKFDSKDIIIFPDGRLDTANAAIYAGLSVKTMAMMRSNGLGAKFIKRGRVFYYKDDLDEWINAKGKATSTAQARVQNQ
ncbi:MAG: hypothetical protein PQ612_00055 [Rickettsiales bacterium]|nr:DNA-binding protein [Pseudomonadota bacterium]MDA0965691.1 DNA-binding protein [Pseudomonadota bacterium]MDG4543015.1 hypothetical protein [Rickettsiales bacterium]MDG4544537.1 hypothetical protein [Rickettsiales bacterium]MDG4546659.1 hypothetical protein [Rickettsiales bacterium]